MGMYMICFFFIVVMFVRVLEFLRIFVVCM